MKMQLNFAFKYDTKGAVRYQELDGKGHEVEIKDGAKIGTMYVRKTALGSGGIPLKLSVMVQEME